MDTMLLDPVIWDLTLTEGGNIALASSKYPRDPALSEAYGQAQDAACQIKLFLGELYYDTAQGIPYWQEILGHLPAMSLIKAELIEAAMLVPGVVAAQAWIESYEGRVLTGRVQITNRAGNTRVAEFMR